MKKAFNGTTEIDCAPKPLIGHEVLERLKGITTMFGKTHKKGWVGLEHLEETVNIFLFALLV